jgi:hypothetical protein
MLPVVRSLFLTLAVGQASIREASAQTAGRTVPVPAGAAIIDGRLDANEWRNAARVEHPAGTVVHLMREGTALFVGIASSRPGFSSLCLATGSDVRVLHASAALGAVTYRRDGETWGSADTVFTYGMRNMALDATAQAERAAYFREHGWVASTVSMNDRAQEVQIDLARFQFPLSLALGRWLSTDAVEYWPESLDAADGCASQRLVMGYVPKALRFNPGTWIAIGR